MATQASIDLINMMYVAYYGRPGDPGGVEYWASVVDANGGDLSSDVIQAFGDSSEFTERFGSLSSEELIDNLYQQMFNRSADQAGKDFYLGEIAAGNMTLADAALDIANGAQNEDLTALNNKISVAGTYTSTVAETGATYGPAQIDAAGDLLETVSEDPISVVNAQAAIEATVVNDGGQVFSLTSETADSTSVMRLTGDQEIRVDFTDPANQIKGMDLNGDGTIAFDGVENNITGVAADFEAVDAYARNPLNQGDAGSNYLGDIAFDGTGWNADGTSTNGNIFLGGLGVDTASGGVGNDFLAGGGVAAQRFVTQLDPEGSGAVVTIDTITGEVRPGAGSFDTDDSLFGGRNADFFFLGLSALDPTDGDALDIDGGETADDTAAAGVESSQDTDWLLLEASDDDEPVYVTLGASNAGADGAGRLLTSFLEDIGGSVDDPDANDLVDIDNLENVDASGNLYSFLDGFSARLGENGMEVNGENVGIGSTAQLHIVGNDETNRFIGGYDNDRLEGQGGNDILLGGNLAYNNNPNTQSIVNDGVDELFGGDGNDELVFELDGGTYDGGADHDTLWLTNLTPGTQTVADLTADGVLRIDLESDPVGAADGHGGADVDGTEDQTNYSDLGSRGTVTNMESVIATGMGALDFLAAGTNDPELTFSNQQNFMGLESVDLDLRGTDSTNAQLDGVRVVDNTLYANSGDDVLEGRGGNDNLSGGDGNDDFYFSIDGDQSGDDLNVIHRQIDADGDNLWDVDAEGANLLGQDFGVNSTSTVGDSSLILEVSEVGNPGNELANITVTEITSVIRDAAGDIAFTLDTPEIRGAATYNELLTAVQDAIAADANIADTLTATLNADNTILITDNQSRTMETQAPDAIFAVTGNNVDISLSMTFGAPAETVAQDRIIFFSYEDRNDAEGVDDDAITGSNISLGTDAYAEDLVVSLGDTTVLAEDQSFDLVFDNLTTEDVVTITVNGVEFQLQVGVDENLTNIPGEDSNSGATQTQIQTAFLARLNDFINSFMDDDTAAGSVGSAVAVAGTTLTLSQNAYNGEETVYMDAPVVTIDNLSGGETASVYVSNQTQTEVTLTDFDGSNNNLDSANVLFWGEEQVNRSVLETALDAGGELNGSDALVIDGGADDDLAGIAHNLAENASIHENFSVHGDDLLIGGVGNDIISGGTGDDRVRGSAGNDTVDGGSDYYAVLRVGDTEASVEELNLFDAAARDAEADVLSVTLIDQTENGTATVSGLFEDTLVFEQADFTPGATEFTVTLNDFSGTGEAIALANGGAGDVDVDVDGDGIFEHHTDFMNMEHIRTVSGIDRAVAGDGQGNDTLDISGLSAAADVGVRFDITNAGTAGNVDLINDPDDDSTTNNNTFTTIITVDGVENVIGGTGDDTLLIDETEAAKNNSFQAGLGDDTVAYSNGFSDADEPTVTINVNSAANTDTVVMTEGRVGATVATDTLVSVEHIELDGNTAGSDRIDDTLNVENVNDAVVDFVNNEVRDGNGNVQVTISNMSELENVVADYSDTVIVSDDMTNSQASTDNVDLQIESFLNFDLLDQRGAAPERLSLGELRSITNGTLETADEGDIPEAENIGLFSFSMGPDADTVDYSHETGLIAAVASFDENGNANVNNVFVSNDGDLDFKDDDNRVDSISDNENVVAAQGADSTIDLTQATVGLKVRFNADDGPTETDVAIDRDTFRIQLSELATTSPVAGINFLEYEDAGDLAPTAELPDQVAAQWNVLHFGDSDDMVEVTDHESTRDLDIFFRGGENEMNFNELTRSIQTVITVVDFDETNPATTGLITATTNFTDGNGLALAGGGTNTATSYSAQNEIAAGGLRIEASQDAEDSVGFGSLEKLFVLGEVIDGSDQITVTLGPDDAANTLELTGYETLLDADSDDVYQMADLDRVLNNLTLSDNVNNDRDTIAVDNDAVGYDNGTDPFTANTIDITDLESVNAFNFDFDILDVTALTNIDTTILGDAADGERQDIVVGDFDTIDSTVGTGISDFDRLVLTDASAGTAFNIDIDAGEFQTGGDVAIFDFDGAQLDLSRISDGRDFVVTVTDDIGAVGSTVIGGAGDDTITGSSGSDVLRGGGGNDSLDGAFTAEAVEVHTYTLTADASATAGGTLTIDGVTITEGLATQGVIVAEDDADAYGAAFVREWDAGTAFTNSASIQSLTYDALTNALTFTFTSAAGDVADGLLGAAAGTISAVASGETVTTAYAAQIDSADDFVFEASASANGVDTINNFDITDQLDFSAFIGGSFFGGNHNTASVADDHVDNEIVVVDNLGTDLTEATVRSLFSDINPSPFHIDADQETVIIEIDSTAVGEDAIIWYAAQDGYVNDFSDATIDVVGSIVGAGDLAFGAGNFI